MADQMSEFDEFMQQEAAKKANAEMESAGKPAWMEANDRLFKAGELSEEERRKSIVFNALAKTDAYAGMTEVHPRPMDSFRGLAMGLETDDTKRQMLEVTPRENLYEPVHESLRDASTREGITHQALLDKYEPAHDRYGSLAAAYRSDRESFAEYYEMEYAQKGRTNPYQGIVEQRAEESIDHGTKRRDAVAELDADPFGNELNRPYLSAAYPDTQTDFWRHSEPLQNGIIKSEADKLNINADAVGPDGKPLSEDDQIRALIVASDLRFGRGNYDFNGPDDFIQKASEMMEREGEQLLEQSEQQRHAAEDNFKSEFPELHEKMTGYADTSAADIEFPSPADVAMERLKADAETPYVPQKQAENEASGEILGAMMDGGTAEAETGTDIEADHKAGADFGGDAAAEAGKKMAENAEANAADSAKYDADRFGEAEADMQKFNSAMNESDSTEKVKKKREHTASM